MEIRKKLLPAVVLTLVFSLSLSLSEVAAKRPNILIIVCDDLNDSISGMGGHPQALTPHIDQLAVRGVTFANAASNVPICGPSRASMWSGLLPTTTGYYGYKQQVNHWNRNPVIAQSTTLFELFTSKGYRNFTTGKIHHNGHEVLEIFENEDGYPGFGSHPNFGPIPNDGKPENKREGVVPPWMPDGARASAGWGDGFGPLQDLKQYGPEYEWTMFYSGEPWHYRDGYNRDPMPDEVHAQEAVRFLEESHKKPFLLTVGFSRPHSPWYAPQEFFDLFPLDGVELAPFLEGDLEDVSKILSQEQDIAQPWGWHKYEKVINNGGQEQLRKWTQAYLACVAFVDYQVGRVLTALNTSEYADNTLVIFTSDHGYHMGEKEYIFKYTPWEESVRVPLIIAGLNVSAGSLESHPVSLVDIYPTCLDFAQLDANGSLDGHSLRPFLIPSSGEWTGPEYSLSATASTVSVKKNLPALAREQHFSIRTEHFRYIRCRNGEEELYDHQKDPNEWVNVAGQSNYFKTLALMRNYFSEATGITLLD